MAFSAQLAQLDTTTLTQKATFGAGCFWSAEAAFHQVPGVVDTIVGYDEANGTELVQVEYDPQQATYERLLDVFWEIDDPTDANRSELYRSVIYFHTPQQEQAARALKQHLDSSGTFRRPIVTDILPAPRFERAPDSDQHYYTRHSPFTCAIG
jgi:peptide-methionine (S)-S-oxide reductase